MSKRTTALIAAFFAAGLMSVNPAWADRGGDRFDRGHGYANARGNGHHAWGWGLGLLAGTAILVAAAQPQPVAIQSPIAVYAPSVPPSAVYSAPTTHWWYYCAQSGGYYPHVNYCPSGWSRVPATPMQ